MAEGFIVAERLRDAGLDVILHCSATTAPASFKSQMKRADASGAAFAVIIGENELASGTVSVKPLRAKVGTETPAPQQTVAADHLTDFLIDAMVATAATDDELPDDSAAEEAGQTDAQPQGYRH